jgi:putative MATE family efflux protein
VLVVPMALQNLVNVGISSTDVIMLGRVGEKVLSGASLGSQIQFIMNLILFGLTSGASVLTAQYWGKKNITAIQTVLGIAMKIAVLVGVLFTVVTFLFPDLLMRIFSNDPAVIQEGKKYLQIVCFSYLFSAVTMVYLNTMRSVERVLIATVVYLVSLVTNICINALLIFGMFGFPVLGVRGAAIGTVVARAAELLIVCYYDRRKNDVFHFNARFLFAKDKLLASDFRKYSFPVILNEMMWGTGASAISAVLGHLGSSVVAANAVVQVTRQLATVVSFGISSATAIMLGKAIGEGKIEAAKEYGRKFVWLSLVVGAIGALVVLVVRPIALTQMVLSEQSQEYLSFMMFVMAYFVIGQAYNTTMIVGVFRAGGDTKFGLYLDVGCLWGIALVGGFLAAFVFHLSVPVVYVILLSDEVIKIPLSTWRYRSYRWLNNVTR